MPPILMSFVELSSTEKSTATVVAFLPSTKSASLANLTSSVLGDPRAEVATSRARSSFWARTRTTATSLTSNRYSCMPISGPLSPLDCHIIIPPRRFDGLPASAVELTLHGQVAPDELGYHFAKHN